MNITYRSHAVERMIERKISTTEVELLILEPDGKIRQSSDKLILYKRLKDRTDNLIATVVLNKKHNSYEVLTVMVNFEVN